MVELTCIIPSKQFIVATLAGLWTKTAKNQIETKVFSLPVQDETGIFKEKYDKVQEQLQCIAAVDDLMSGLYVCVYSYM